jgi:hypothetical protein
MLATDGSAAMVGLTAQVRKIFPFGEWLRVADQKEGVQYTGRRIRLGTHGDILVDQEKFISGRLVVLPPCNGKGDLELCDPEAQSNFRTAVGGLHWLSSQSRPDLAVCISRLQKVPNSRQWTDYRDLSKIIKFARESAPMPSIIKPVKHFCVLAWTDSALLGADGEEKDIAIIPKEARAQYHSQGGCLLGVGERKSAMKADEIDFFDCRLADPCIQKGAAQHIRGGSHDGSRSRRSCRVLARYLCDVLWGRQQPLLDFGEDQIPTIAFADARSLTTLSKKDRCRSTKRSDLPWQLVGVSARRGHNGPRVSRNFDGFRHDGNWPILSPSPSLRSSCY